MSPAVKTVGWSAAVLGVTLLLGSTSQAEPPPPATHLTLEDALSTARQNNRLLQAARLRISEAEGSLTGASLLLVDNPDLVASAGPRSLGIPDGFRTTDIEIGVEQRFEIGGQRGHRIDRARAELDATAASADDVQRIVDLAVAQVFYATLAAEARLGLLLQNERLAGDLHDVARRRLDAGEGTPLELNTARIRLAETRRRTVAARTVLGTSTVRLAEILGLPPATRLALRGDLPRDEESPRPDELVSRAMRARPDLAAASRLVEAAGAAIGLAEAEAWPDPALGVSYAEEEGDRIVKVGLRVPIPFFNRNQGGRERASATRARTLAEQGALRLSIESEVRQALLAYGQALTALRLYDAGVLRAQEESFGLLQRALEAGEVGVPDVIVVQREVIEGREGYLQARLELARARARVLAAASLPQTATLQGGKP